MSAKDINILLKNNTGNKDKTSLIDSFVVRTKVFSNIISEIKSSKLNKPEQNYLIIGQRGAGKTTLLYRIKYAIEDDLKLSSVIIPIMLSEEQYNLLELMNLWETIADNLDEYEGFGDLYGEIEKQSENKLFNESTAYELIEKALKKQEKKIIVFIENVDVFFKKIGSKGQKRLREILSSSSRIRLISSSTTHFDGVVNNSDAFYDFFKIIQLDGLSKDESKKLLYKLAEQKNELGNIENIIKAHPRRLESLRRLTGGNPRIISYLFHIFLDNENGKAIVDLYKLLDDITFLYKAELDQLSAQQQKVIDGIARNWDAISTKEIAQKTKIDSKQVSSILNILEKNQIVEVISTSTKNNLYRIKDRFLNIWYLMRFGKKKEIENVIWLVRFFDTWCNKSELSERIASHIKNLESGNYDMTAALDMGNVYLSCENVPHHIKHNLYQKTISILPRNLAKGLIMSTDTLASLVKKLVKQKKWDEAIKAADEITDQRTKLLFKAWIYLAKKDPVAIDYFLELFELDKQPEFALIIANLIMSFVKDKNEAYRNKVMELYKMAIDGEQWEAYEKLGDLYFYEVDDLDEAKKYYRLAIEKGIDSAIMSLAEILFIERDFTESQILVQRAINNGEKVKNNLGLILEGQNKIDDAIAMYQQAINDGEDNALLTLGNFYYKRNENKDYEKAKELFEIAISKNINEAYASLGRLYLKNDRLEDAETVLLVGVKKQNEEAAHALAHFYSRKKAWKKAEDLFVKSMKWGKISSLFCLANMFFNENKENKKEYILSLFEQNYKEVKVRPSGLLLYCKYLVWNNQAEKSIDIVKENFEPLVYISTKYDNEIITGEILQGFTEFVTFLISRGLYNVAYDLFSFKENTLKNILKPVYYALMEFMKKEYPNEYLKAGDELQETISEILKEIQVLTKKYE